MFVQEWTFAWDNMVQNQSIDCVMLTSGDIMA